ncbi:MAG: hypothetical protein WBN75_04655 [Verrucomicrobiia bacterium]|jgi:hypothetical protein
MLKSPRRRWMIGKRTGAKLSTQRAAKVVAGGFPTADVANGTRELKWTTSVRCVFIYRTMNFFGCRAYLEHGTTMMRKIS